MTLTEETQNGLAREIQKGFPLEPKPFDVLAQQVSASPEDVLGQLQQWSEDGKLREVSAVLEGSALGYDSALVAGRVPEAQIERVAAIVSEHPTVTHNYLRNHDYNLWFTIAAPTEMGIEASLSRLADAAGMDRFLPLRRTLTFKIGVNFDLKRRHSSTARTQIGEVAQVELTEEAKRLFRALQTPLPLSPRPFGELAERAGVSEGALLEFANHHLGGAVRRYVATFRHRKLGVRGNGMAVWQVPASDQERVGTILAEAPEVSHCYARSTVEGFPYSVYSMIHGPDREAVGETVKRLSGETKIDDYQVLFSTQEFKKCRLRYFLPELDEWWARHPSRSAA